MLYNEEFTMDRVLCHENVKNTHDEPPTDWPSSGNVEFSKYSTRYRPELDLVVELSHSCSQKATKAESSVLWISATRSPFEACINNTFVGVNF